MGKAIIQNYTTKNPIQMIGFEAGVCWGANTSDENQNYKRGLSCLEAEHGRTFEFPDVYLELKGYSARTIREFYTHIGGAPTRLQESTRYIDYTKKGFEYIIPPSVDKIDGARVKYNALMRHINSELKALIENYNIPNEDAAMGLPLGMQTSIVVKINLRTLMTMSHQRLCSRAYWEFRELFKDLMRALKEYSKEWEYLVNNYFKAKCEMCGYCTEAKSCGRKPKKDKFFEIYQIGQITGKY